MWLESDDEHSDRWRTCRIGSRGFSCATWRTGPASGTEQPPRRTRDYVHGTGFCFESGSTCRVPGRTRISHALELGDSGFRCTPGSWFAELLRSGGATIPDVPGCKVDVVLDPTFGSGKTGCSERVAKGADGESRRFLVTGAMVGCRSPNIESPAGSRGARARVDLLECAGTDTSCRGSAADPDGDERRGVVSGWRLAVDGGCPRIACTATRRRNRAERHDDGSSTRQHPGDSAATGDGDYGSAVHELASDPHGDTRPGTFGTASWGSGFRAGPGSPALLLGTFEVGAIGARQTHRGARREVPRRPTWRHGARGTRSVRGPADAGLARSRRDRTVSARVDGHAHGLLDRCATAAYR